jgi:hypothetical protein
MNIIGWDIGIKNLAFCLLKKLDTTNTNEDDKSYDFVFKENKYKIQDWNVINVVDQVNDNLEDEGTLIISSRPKVKCSIVNEKRKTCVKNAVYCKEQLKNGEYEGLCANHFAKLNYSRLPKVEKKSILH